jgi:hypothetical protein
MLVNSEKRQLHGLFGILVVIENDPHHSVHALLMAANQLLECPPISAQNAIHQCKIFIHGDVANGRVGCA